MIRFSIVMVLGLFISVAAAESKSDKLQKIIDGEHRSIEHKARDKYRHPLQTLDFFEVRDDMTVVEIWPGGGWYTEILAPFLRDKGKLYAAHFFESAPVPYFQKSLQDFKRKVAEYPEIYGALQLTVLQPPEKLVIAPESSADRVLTFRNIHNWMKSGQAENVFAAMYRALKPGGILGVVEHRNPTYIKQDPQAVSGYVREDYVIQLAERSGFELVAKSEVNANPKDTAKHPKGVWTLPPALRLGEQNRTKYLEIGESDRMTLKFIKPIAKNNKGLD